MSDARVSIVVPAFNAERFISTALRSVRAQTFRDWEAIVVDDGSTDGTATIVQDIARKDARIRLVRQANGGPSSARNLGIRHATCEWLLFLDADDWLLPDHVHKLFTAAEKDPATEVTCCAYQRVTQDGTKLPMEWWPEVETRPFEAFAQECVLCIHCVLVRTALVRAVGGFDVGLKTCEDWDLWLRIARMGKQFVALREPLGRYRMRADSLSTDSQSLFTDALTVMGRAWNLDPRVASPDPRYVNGIQGSIAESYSHVACWLAGVEAGAGRDPLPILERLPAELECDDGIDAIAECVMQAYKVGAGIAPHQLADHWSRLSASARLIFGEFATRAHRPEMVTQLMSTLESKVLKHCDLGRPIKLTTMVGVRLDLQDFFASVQAVDVDAIHLELRAGHELLGHAVVPAWSLANPGELATFTVRQSGLKKIILRGGLLARPRFWLHLVNEVSRSVGELHRALHDKRVSRKRRLLSIARAAVGRSVVSTIGARLARLGARAEAPIEIIEQERLRAVAEHAFVGIERQSPADLDEGGDRKQYWEQIFAHEDPWNYGSRYEQVKYERTLEILGNEVVDSAMEIACAEGRFTSLLAPRVGKLRAVDISSTAVQRARARCDGHSNIEFGELDLLADELAAPVDLIVCSEVLYFVSSDELPAVAAKFCAGLKPRGRLVMAHASCIGDDPTRTGFDWGHEFGARTICETFAATAGLALERSIVTDLYRIDLFRKIGQHDPHPLSVTQQLPLDHELDLSVERFVVWGGAATTRAEVARSKTDILPVLCYHRIAEEGPEQLAGWRVTPAMFDQQLKLLRRHGWHAVSMNEFSEHLRYNAPFHGRPVLFTFDDGYADFATHAWPIMLRNDFAAAEVFLVTDKVGDCADWDEHYGPPARLMDWQEIARLKADGVSFGSHLATHRAADAMSCEELLREAARSRAVLETRLGTKVLAVATPFGAIDSRIAHIYATCGYKLAFSTTPHLADVRRNPLHVPRIEVDGHWDLETFARAVGVLTPALAEVIG